MAAPLSPRMPSPPPPAEIQLMPGSPGGSMASAPAELPQTKINSQRRIHPGTKARNMAAGPPLVSIHELDSEFQLQEHLAALHYHLTDEGTQPITREKALHIATPPLRNTDKTLWLYELGRFLIARCNTLIVGFLFDDPPCSASTCPEMRASEWQFLCAVHDSPRTCCAIDYCCHTLDWAANIITDPSIFPSPFYAADLTNRSVVVKHLANIFRRLHRIFAHAWFQHRRVFWETEERTGLYVLFKVVCDVFGLLPNETYKLPPEAEGLEPEPETSEPAQEGHGEGATSTGDRSLSLPSESTTLTSEETFPGGSLTILNKSRLTSSSSSSSSSNSINGGSSGSDGHRPISPSNTRRRHVRSSPSTGSAVTTVMEADEEETSRNRSLPDGQSATGSADASTALPTTTEEEEEETVLQDEVNDTSQTALAEATKEEADFPVVPLSESSSVIGLSPPSSPPSTDSTVSGSLPEGEMEEEAGVEHIEEIQNCSKEPTITVTQPSTSEPVDTDTKSEREPEEKHEAEAEATTENTTSENDLVPTPAASRESTVSVSTSQSEDHKEPSQESQVSEQTETSVEEEQPELQKVEEDEKDQTEREQKEEEEPQGEKIQVDETQNVGQEDQKQEQVDAKPEQEQDVVKELSSPESGGSHTPPSLPDEDQTTKVGDHAGIVEDQIETVDVTAHDEDEKADVSVSDVEDQGPQDHGPVVDVPETTGPADAEADVRADDAHAESKDGTDVDASADVNAVATVDTAIDSVDSVEADALGTTDANAIDTNRLTVPGTTGSGSNSDVDDAEGDGEGDGEALSPGLSPRSQSPSSRPTSSSSSTSSGGGKKKQQNKRGKRRGRK